MSDALSIAASGLKSEEFFIDKIASDLANLNTANYKASTLSFEDTLYQNLQGSRTNNQKGIQIGMGTSVLKSGKNLSKGALQASTNPYDIAINGQGFYQVTTMDGDIAYSRNSTLSKDKEGYLCTQSGLRLADNLQIPEDATSISINKNGEVEASFSDSSEPQLLGSIQLATFMNPEQLTPLGSGLYQANEETGEAILGAPETNGLGAIEQYQIENSNVDMVSTLMQLTMAQRVYQLNAKAVQIADELEKLTNELRG